MTYEARITALTNVREHPNADKLKLATAHGHQVVVGLDHVDGDVGVFFPTDGVLDHQFCLENELYPITDENGNRIGGGFFSPKKARVRAQRFRGEKSEGFWIPLSSLAYTGVKLDDLHEGYTFDTINGQKICEKWYAPATLRAMQAGQSRARKENAMFAKHIDTLRYQYDAEKYLQAGALVWVSEKLHGTCLSPDMKVSMADGSKRKIRTIQKDEYVLGMNSFGHVVPSKVVDVYNHGKINSQWVRLETSRSGAGKGSYFARLFLTPDHQVFSDGQWVEAQSLKPGDAVTLLRSDRALSYFQEQVLIGKLLGDASLRSERYSASVHWGHAEKAMTEWTTKALGDLGNPWIEQQKSGYGSTMWRSGSYASAFIKEAFDEWLDGNGKKIFPKSFIDKLGPVALAFWYMDDGSLGYSDDIQNNTANFAVCAFDDDSVANLQASLLRLGIESVAFRDSQGRNRLRLNSDEAEKLFVLVAPYIVPEYKHKLPQRYRGHAPFMPPTVGGYKPTTVEQVVRKITFEDQGVGGNNRWDLTTETSNFFASDILIHNSQRVGYVLDEVESPKRWYHKVFGLTPRSKREWNFVVGTRNIVLRDPVNQGFYEDDSFRFKVVENLRDNLKKGEIIYGEIVGWAGPETPIMARQNLSGISELKEVRKRFGSEMTYTYGCLPGDCEFYVYRITQANEDGDAVELSWTQVRARCSELGIKTVPEFSEYPFYLGAEWTEADLKSLQSFIDTQMELAPSLLDDRHMREGVVVRVECLNGETVWLKNKTFEFGLAEGYLKSNDDYVDREEAS